MILVLYAWLFPFGITHVCRKICGLIWRVQLNLVIKFLRKPRVDWAATECTANLYSYRLPAKRGEVCRYQKRSGIEAAKRAQFSPNLNLNSAPSVCAEERRSRRNRASDCLSEASSSSTPAGLSTAGCPQRSGGTQTVGSPSLCLLSLGEARESESPAAATERHQDFAKNAVIESSRRLRQAQPDPSIPQPERNRASIPQPERETRNQLTTP